MNPILTGSSRRTLLNPNASEFFPTSLRSSSSAIANIENDTGPSRASDSGNTPSDKSVLSDTCASDEESLRYWSAQLPDDILTPETDFIMSAPEEGKEPGTGSFVSESFGMKESIDHVAEKHWGERIMLNGKQLLGCSQVAQYKFAASRDIPRQLWEEEHAMSSFQLSPTNENWNGPLFDSQNGSLPSPAFGQAALKEDNTVDALSVLSNEFPNIPVESLADLYRANGGDLSMTVRMLSQIKLQGEAPSWRGLSHFPEDVDSQDPEFPRLVRKNNHHHGPAEFSFRPPSFSSMSSYSGLFDRRLHEDRFDLSYHQHKHHLSPRDWAETDDAVVNLLFELTEEARNYGRIRDVYFEQARQAFIVGNRVLAKEASVKGQSHNRLMKAALNKAAEIELQRVVFNAQASSCGPGQTQHVDLRGHHVSEAIHTLKRDLSALRLAARSSRQCQQVFIRVGTGHQRGTRIPASLLFAVKRYLTEEELLNVAEAQPGILKVVVS